MQKFLYKKLGHLLLPAIIISLALGVETTFAAEDTYQDFLQNFGRFMSLIGSLINMLLWIVIKFIGDLLTNDFIFGAGIEDMLKSIWQTVRNFVNIAFVFVLLVIAFYNIVSIDPEKIPLKKSLGKVAIALILVNFSYFAAKVVLDVANVLTTAVFAIPRDIITDLQLSTAEMEYGNDAIGMTCSKRAYLDQIGNSSEDPVEATDQFLADNNLFGQIKYDPDENDPERRAYVDLPTKCYIPNLVKIKLFKDNVEVEDGVPFAVANYDELKVVLYYKDDAGVIHPFDEDMVQVTKGGMPLSEFEEEYRPAELSAKKFGRNTITMILAKTMFDLNKLTKISAASTSGFFGLTISGMVNLLLLILYGTMFVAMFIVLIFRVVYLWICIAFSPLVALMFVFKDFGIDMPDEANIGKLFIKYAFVPVKMGIALSVGVLMIFQANRQLLEPGEETLTLGEKAADIQIPIDTLVNDSSIQKLMWNIATVAVIWIAIKWSLKDLSGPVQGIVDKITGYVGAVGEVAAKIPLTLPIAPYWNSEEGGERKMTTLGAALRAARATNLDRIVEGMITGQDRKYTEMRQDITDRLNRITNQNQTGDLAELTRNDSYMEHLMNDTDVTNRNNLANRLQLVGAINGDDLKKFKEASSTPEAFRTHVVEPTIRLGHGETYFPGYSGRSWQTSGASSELPELKASASQLFDNNAQTDSNHWNGVPVDAATEIKGKLDSIYKDAADIIRSKLEVEQAEDTSGVMKYDVAKTKKVVEDVVAALNVASTKTGKAREDAGSHLTGQAEKLFDQAVKKLPAPQSGATAGGAGGTSGAAGGGSGTATGGSG